MNQGKICVSICGESADEVTSLMRSAGAFADVMEIRFDCLRPVEVSPLIERLAAAKEQILITFRPTEQGGKRPLTVEERGKFRASALSRLSAANFLFDQEFDMPATQNAASEQTIVSLHDFESPGHDLQQRLTELGEIPGKMIKIAVAVDDAADAIQVWKLLETANKPVIPIAMGEAGKWTRILGLAHGTPMTYASPEAGTKTAPGQISATDLRDVFRVKELDRETRIYGVIAGDTSYSLSPYMHNAAFKHAAINCVFVPLQVKDLEKFIRRMVDTRAREIELNFRGFSVTNPHKQAIMNHLDFVDDTARKIGAVNTVKITDGKLHGYNTDAPGFISPLKKVFGDVKGARVAVVGSGGAARACVYSLRHEGADVTLFARDLRRAATFADEFGAKIEELTSGRKWSADILVNATPVGTRGSTGTETVATSGELRDVKLVYDLVYNPAETLLLSEAKRAGAKTLGGLEMLVAQGAEQFFIWTGNTAPASVMKEAVIERLNKTNAG